MGTRPKGGAGQKKKNHHHHLLSTNSGISGSIPFSSGGGGPSVSTSSVRQSRGMSPSSSVNTENPNSLVGTSPNKRDAIHTSIGCAGSLSTNNNVDVAGGTPQSSKPTDDPTSDGSGQQYGDGMQSRRESIFASLVGNRVNVKLRDSGGVINGCFCISGNSATLPSAWSEERSSSSLSVGVTGASVPQPPPAESSGSNSVYVCLGSMAGAEITAQESGWKNVSGGGQRKRKADQQHRHGEDSVGGSGRLLIRGSSSSENRSASLSSSQQSHSIAGCYLLPYESYMKYCYLNDSVQASSFGEKSFLWLKYAYRLPDVTVKSSDIFDWLAIDWNIIYSIVAENIPDGSELALRAKDVRKVSNMVGGTFQTDTEISATGGGSFRPLLGEKKLQKWSDGGAMSTTGGGNDGLSSNPMAGEILFWPAEGDADSKDKAGGSNAFGGCTWDQFEENERTFGVKSTYVDGMYSTKLNINDIPDEVQKHAERLAEEMESSQRGRHRGRSHSRDAGPGPTGGPGGRWRRLNNNNNDRDTYSSYNERDREDDFYNDDDEEARFSAVIPPTTTTTKTNIAGGPPPSYPHRHSTSQKGPVGAGYNVTAASGGNAGGFDHLVTNPRLLPLNNHQGSTSSSAGGSFRRSGAGLARNRSSQVTGPSTMSQDGGGGGGSSRSDYDNKFVRNPAVGGAAPPIPPALTGGDAVPRGSAAAGTGFGNEFFPKPAIYGGPKQNFNILLAQRQNNSASSTSLSQRQAAVESASGLLEAPSEQGAAHVRKKVLPVVAPPPLPEVSSKSVKDNINALNLEPIRSRYHPVAGIPLTVGTGTSGTINGISPTAIDSLSKRRARRAEFAAALSEISRRMEKKGWLDPQFTTSTDTVDAVSNRSATDPDNAADLASQQKKAGIAASSKCELARVLTSALRSATADAASNNPNNSRPSANLTAIANSASTNNKTPKPTPDDIAQDSARDSARELKSFTTSRHNEDSDRQKTENSNDGGASVGGTTNLSAEERLLVAKRMFQFNPNASSFTPKESTSEIIHPASQPASKLSVLEPFDPQLLELRRKEKKAAGIAYDPAKSLDEYITGVEKIVTIESPAEISPDWSQKMGISYTELLDNAVMDSLPYLHPINPDGPTATAAMMAPGPIMPGHFPGLTGIPPPLLHGPMTSPMPTGNTGTGTIHQSAGPAMRFPNMGNLMSVCESSVVGIATTGHHHNNNNNHHSGDTQMGIPQFSGHPQFLPKNLTSYSQIPSNASSTTPTNAGTAPQMNSAPPFGTPFMYGYPQPHGTAVGGTAGSAAARTMAALSMPVAAHAAAPPPFAMQPGGVGFYNAYMQPGLQPGLQPILQQSGARGPVDPTTVAWTSGAAAAAAAGAAVPHLNVTGVPPQTNSTAGHLKPENPSNININNNNNNNNTNVNAQQSSSGLMSHRGTASPPTDASQSPRNAVYNSASVAAPNIAVQPQLMTAPLYTNSFPINPNDQHQLFACLAAQQQQALLNQQVAYYYGQQAAAAAPITTAPITAAPMTAAPMTAAPITAAPITAAPITAAGPPQMGQANSAAQWKNLHPHNVANRGLIHNNTNLPAMPLSATARSKPTTS